jgi:hypothetical protein
MRLAISGVDAFELDQLIELDLEVLHHDATLPISSLTAVADSLPGLGIVAAVLGVVITMGALGGPPEEIGHKVAAAFVGIFLGILLCYGLIGPVASNMAKTADDEKADMNVLRVVIISFLKGTAPILAVEAARRAVPGHVRQASRNLKKDAADKAQASLRPSRQQSRRRPLPREPSLENTRPIVVIKKKVGHGGHHGGAWKVAYADFVTAMMALFIVLWLLTTSKPVREAIAGYFRDPSGTAGKLGTTLEGKGETVVSPKRRYGQAEAGDRKSHQPDARLR